MLIGYGRVSTRDQNLFLQEDALRQAGCEEIYMEKVTGTKKNRPELNRMLNRLRPGDTIVVWKLARWGRSLADLIYLVNLLREKGVSFRCLAMAMDTSTAEGRLVYNLFGALAEFERETIVENTNAGLAAARARGRTGGRKPGLSEKAKKKADMTALLYKEGRTVAYICDTLEISRRTVYAYLCRKEIKIGTEKLENQTRQLD